MTWYKAIFWIEATEPYPHSKGGQKLGALEVLPISNRYMYMMHTMYFLLFNFHVCIM